MLASSALARVQLVSCHGATEGILITLTTFHSFLMQIAVSMEVCDVFYSKYNLYYVYLEQRKGKINSSRQSEKKNKLKKQPPPSKLSFLSLPAVDTS